MQEEEKRTNPIINGVEYDYFYLLRYQFPEGLTLDEKSRELFELGCEGQGYVGTVDLETGKIYLIPAFNKGDGKPRLAINKKPFELFIESEQPLGGSTGDVHRLSLEKLGLGASGESGRFMGFGVFKGENNTLKRIRSFSTSNNAFSIRHDPFFYKLFEACVVTQGSFVLKRGIPWPCFKEILGVLRKRLNIKSYALFFDIDLCRQFEEGWIEKGVNGSMENGDTFLFLTIQNQRFDMAHALLERGADPNQACQDGQTPLCLVIENQNFDTAHLLLEWGANPNQANKDGQIPLCLAIEKQNLEMVRALLEWGADPNQAGRDEQTPLELAIKNGDQAIIQILHDKLGREQKVENWAERYTEIQAEITQAMSAFTDQNRQENQSPNSRRSIRSDLARFSVVRQYLVQHEIKGISSDPPLFHQLCKLIHSISDQKLQQIYLTSFFSGASASLIGVEQFISEENKWMSLYLAIQYENVDLVRALLKAGADPNQPYGNGMTLFWVALQHGNLAIVRALLAAKANPDQADSDGMTPLLYAVDKGNLAMVRVLLAAKAKPDQAGINGMTPLLWATRKDLGKDDLDIVRASLIVRALLKAGADPKQVDSEGATPLYYAIRSRCLKMVEAILEVEANLANQIQRGSMTPLMLAISTSNLDILRVLLDKGADPKQTLENKEPPLILAARFTQGAQFVEALLEAGAAVDVKGKDGRNALHIAVLKENLPLVELLIKKDEHFALLNQPDSSGKTPFQLAAQHPEIAELLLAREMQASARAKPNGVAAASNLGSASFFQFPVDRGAPVDESKKPSESNQTPEKDEGLVH